MSTSSIAHLEPGCGRITLSSHLGAATFSELASTYPLKLISPKVASKPEVAIVYVLSYGGGLVGGDQIYLSVKVDAGTILLLLSQGFTKVFTTRIQQRLITSNADTHSLDNNASYYPTYQKMEFNVSPGSAVFLLPDPVTCFRSASYRQKQIFHLSKDSSLILLDWFTSGRKSRGEEWVFSTYNSENEVFVEGVRLAKDATLLEEHASDNHPSLPPRSLADKLAPYSCYATVILYGPLLQGTTLTLTEKYEAVSVMKLSAPPNLLWSLSQVRVTSQGHLGTVIRVAGKETELVKDWLSTSLHPIVDVVGMDVYRRVFT
ncbi:urease accessory protein ured [Moniliophthora roreri MCA 2997]|uniref:Urease accessory protein ured n=1 Tax=Moniliophthora roreri (strain MCA 2997) TaxID=1381753 RepID=V2XZK5_MONRO|nr:urease accessory protein ured [Moniliophthora roreri MCA 2997]